MQSSSSSCFLVYIKRSQTSTFAQHDSAIKPCKKLALAWNESVVLNKRNGMKRYGRRVKGVVNEDSGQRVNEKSNEESRALWTKSQKCCEVFITCFDYHVTPDLTISQVAINNKILENEHNGSLF
ncbi:hypothetical protein F8M41_006168 [Gigaspora margarita]|uniref:Uncharacterized protein n=1 Tax=Gigaspora margarita TaxID=4874 RepID=A0A8H4AX62_GIGMA|nr:hypothetical protein F8M41_006168 [Gigaspora margarita]